MIKIIIFSIIGIYTLLSYQQHTVAMVISAEACGEGEQGMLAVANTIQNRMLLKGRTAYEVVTEPHQYSGYTAQNRLTLYNECKEIALPLSENIGQLQDITNGAIYFKRPEETRRKWHNILTVIIGNHEFYKE